MEKDGNLQNGSRETIPDERPDFGGGGKRYFGRGRFKYALLELLTVQPMHGYQMMKALEEQSGGLYFPSPGSIYPTLQMLEERGLVTANEQEGKKVYQITDEGRAFLNEKRAKYGKQGENGAFPAPMDGWCRYLKPAAPYDDDGPGIARLLAKAERRVNAHPEYVERYRQIVEQTRNELVALLNEMRDRYGKECGDHAGPRGGGNTDKN
jgi:DNA-binding PadR family transcriptional regulator